MTQPGPTSPPLDSWAVFNEFLLNGPLDRFSKILARYELFRRTVNLPGDVVECGVCKGAGLLLWAKMIQIFNPLSTKKVIGFDLFDQEPEQRTHEWDHLFLRDEVKNVRPADIKAVAEAQGLGHRVEIVAGDACRTVAEYAKANPGFRISLLNLDFDNYDPTLASLKTLYPLVVPRGVVLLDDYSINIWGASLAVDEYFEGSGTAYEALPWALSPKAYVIKGGSAMKTEGGRGA